MDRYQPNFFIDYHLASADRVRGTEKILVVYGDPPGVRLDGEQPWPFVNPKIDIREWVPIATYKGNSYIAVRKDLAEKAGVTSGPGVDVFSRIKDELP